MMHEIDGAKLKAKLKEKVLFASEVSQNMGYNSNFLTVCASRGTIADYGLKGLERCTGITLDDIKRDEPEEINVDLDKPLRIGMDEFLEQHRVIIDIDYERLNREVFGAVYGAIKKASIDGWLG